MQKISPQQLSGHPNIGLTLSGGGARGAAHIGLIRALNEYGIYPNRIVGVSAGAIVGTLYASGMDADEMLEFVTSASMIKVIKFGMPRTGLTTMDYLRERLKIVAPDDSFEALGISLAVGVTNLNQGQFEIFEKGPLHEVVAASCSVPFVFKPVKINDEFYVDGGVMNNMATAPLLGKSDYIIGCNLMPDNVVSNEELSSMVGISRRCFVLSVKANTVGRRQDCDMLFEPTGVAEHNIFSFKKIRELHDIGYAYAKEKLELLLANSNDASI